MQRREDGPPDLTGWIMIRARLLWSRIWRRPARNAVVVASTAAACEGYLGFR
jgi:hypothetical protein